MSLRQLLESHEQTPESLSYSGLLIEPDTHMPPEYEFITAGLENL